MPGLDQFLAFQGLIENVRVVERHHRVPVIQIRHDIDNAHAVVEHLSDNRVSKGMRREPINFTVWTEQWRLSSESRELRGVVLELIQSVFSAKQIARPEVIGDILD